ncbi:MAG: radical SAM protein [Clostridia bacterium]|nr:radical SAM protein [Clostridia bacterium]MBQ9737792.1 radical SAM protein [Clostridia bacterium]
MRKYNLPIFIPHSGCPHDCAFCNQRKITGVDTEVTAGEVKALIQTFLSTIAPHNSTTEVAFFGGSFTGLNLKTQEEFLKAAAEFYPQISGIRLSTRPDYINDEILALLKKYGVTTVELGVQSSDDAVLEANKRGHNFQSVIDASKKIKDAGIFLGHQMMLGMYNSTPQKDRQTVYDILALKPDCVRIYPVVTLKGTALENYYKSGKYIPYSVEEAAELAKFAVVKFREQNIDVIRMGLHSSEELENGDTVVAGPYHPAFGEIVESLIYRDLIEDAIMEKGARGGVFNFCCKASDISKAVGHKKMNTLYFKEKYNVEIKIESAK